MDKGYLSSFTKMCRVRQTPPPSIRNKKIVLTLVFCKGCGYSAPLEVIRFSLVNLKRQKRLLPLIKQIAFSYYYKKIWIYMVEASRTESYVQLLLLNIEGK